MVVGAEERKRGREAGRGWRKRALMRERGVGGRE